MQPLRILLGASFLALPTVAQHPSAQALGLGPTIHRTCRCEAVLVPDPPPEVQQRRAPFSFAVTWDASVPTSHRPVIQHAIDEWEDLIDDDGLTVNPLPITVQYNDLGGGLGLTTTAYFFAGGVSSATVRFDNATTTWFVDSTPQADEEFDADGGAGPAGFDLLTVARHELGHAVGYIDGAATSLSFLTTTSGGAGTTFDAPRCNVPWTAFGGGHTDPAFFPNDMMAPTVGPSTRRPLNAYFHGAVLSRMHQYTIRADFVDLLYSGNNNGSAHLPWETFAAGYFLSPSSGEVWVRPGTYLEAPLTLSTPKRIQALRGGTVTIN